ncbi:glycoside hydrolase family 5 protein [Aporhodopirellula aestuarii]|uniref:Cellulase family glycosylhydrolase n=1 Tax=Aporhodopirellula aestuarii TaxID=2950107 RepID=A0ABT0U4J8_9BACT|nr:cellulase family glycosylhydrolase [Aporhodopirellula aestuarii]MCM2371604.1 cellulase family glycosylhydrolase [Aporhodopirellula aestuarii]
MKSLGILVAVLLAFQTTTVTAQSLPDPSPTHLPRWRGFNLLEKFHLDWSNGPFQESDFKMISDLGFNFVRLPMDYRVWIQNRDWNRFNEKTLREIDQAVAWGEKYSIHVCLNFHRAPGYTVASPPESTNLWTDPETQRVCAKHWAEFARRYKKFSNRNLSFNLFNEPTHVDASQYVEVVKKIAEAIREHDPDRLIICDGLDWGQQPVETLKELGVAQATRGYAPVEITHYRANWMKGSDQYPVPTWPQIIAHATLYAPTKSEIAPEARRPLRIHSQWNADTSLRFRVGTVSSTNTLVVRADGKPLFEKTFDPGPGDGEWRSVEYFPQWKLHRAVYNRNYQTTIPAGTQTIEIAVIQGDWLSLTEIGIGYRNSKGFQRETKLQFSNNWAVPPSTLTYQGPQPGIEASPTLFASDSQRGRQWLWDETVAPWQKATRSGIGVIVGEFGCYHKTPHDITLAWMEDNLANWQRADIGWALWNFRGSFGILDSERSDVKYERYQGHMLDRKMLDLLQRY